MAPKPCTQPLDPKSNQMLLPAPNIDERSADKIVEETRTLAPFYAPEWDAQETQGAGFALLQNFAQLLFDVAQHLNLTPAKNFVEFLDRLGVKLQPPRSARVPVTFLLAPGTPENVLIPARTQAAAEATDTRPEIVFETEQNLLATIATLQAVHSIQPSDDAIYEHLSGLKNPSSSELFAGKDLQEHSIYLAHSELFDLKAKAEIKIQFVILASGLTPADFSNGLSWEWWNKDHWVPSTVLAYKEVSNDFPAVTTLKSQISPNDIEIRVTMDVESDVRFPNDGLLLIDNEIINYTGKTGNKFTVVTRGFGANQIPGASVAATHAAGAQVRAIDRPLFIMNPTVAAQNGRQIVTITLKKEFDTEFTKTKINGIENLWIRCRTLKSPILKHSPLRNLQIDTIRASTSVPSSSQINPNGLFYNDVPLDIPDPNSSPSISIYPFGKQPRTFDTFYIASEDALSKKGGSITLDFNIILGGIASVPVQQVQGIGPRFTSRLQAQDIDTVDKLLGETPEQLAAKLGTNRIRALNILEAAQKEFYDKTGIFKAIPGVITPTPREVLMLSWEYWDGNGWKVITQLTDTTNKLRTSGALKFPCPEDIATTSVNGQENYWIRVRIVSGDYGKERFTFDGKTVQSNTSQIRPPIINSLKIKYSSTLENLQRCLMYNNLNFADQTQNTRMAGTLFQPFQPPEEDKPSFYIGFEASFTITEKTLERLKPEGIPDEALENLKGLKGQKFTGVEAFLSVLKTAIGDQQAVRFNPLILKYVSFDKSLVGGPISIFFSLDKQEYLEETKPRLQWQYWDGSAWVLLDVLDDTDNLTRGGLLRLVGPADFAAREKFGTQLFWIRAVDVENRFQPPSLSSSLALSRTTGASRLLRFTRLTEFQPSGFLQGLRLSAFPANFFNMAALDAASKMAADSLTEKPCPELLELFHPKFSIPAGLSQFPPSPILEGIFLNTAWAIQAETIRDEILGSSDGRKYQKYTLMRNPIVSEEIWVNEINSLLEEERKKLSEQDPSQIQEVRDERGDLTQVWVRWRSVEDFLDSASTSRDYVIDRAFGILQFGDGTTGTIPPIGVDNIKTNYQFGGGAQGNVEVGTVISLKTSVAGVDEVTNPEPAGGGADTDILAKALERGPQVIKHRNRAIAREDFEWLARQAYNSIAKVRCLPTTNQNGEFETGWVTVIIVPQSQETQPLPSAELIRQVKRYLADRCPNVVPTDEKPEKLIVTGPAYVEVSVTAEVFATSIDLISQVESETIKSLKKFLHPLTGGLEGEGWDFGRLVCLSDIIAMLESLPNVDHVDNLAMQLRDTLTNTTRTITGDVLLSAALPPYAMIFSGQHDIKVKFKAQP